MKNKIIHSGIALFLSLILMFTTESVEVRAYDDYEMYQFSNAELEKMLHAENIKLGETITGYLEQIPEEDTVDSCKGIRWYRITIPENVEPGWFTVSCAQQDGIEHEIFLTDTTGDWNGFFTEDTIDKRAVISGMAYDDSVKLKSARGSKWLLPKVTPGETYYIVIRNLQWKSNVFRLRTEIMPDDNLGTYEAAVPLQCGEYQKGRIEYPEDIDCYSVELPKNENKYILHVYSQNNSSVTIEDEPGKEIDTIKCPENSSQPVFMTKGDGQKLYVKIKGDEGRGNYTVWYEEKKPEKVTKPSSKPASKPTPQKKKAIIKTVKVTKCKKGTKKIVGKTISGAKVQIKTCGKKYTCSSDKTGKFTVTLKQKLKKKQTVKITVSKKNYKTREIITRAK